MILSDISVKRPVFASVIGLLLLALGWLAFDRLPLREYPAIDPPIVSIDTDYPGAAASVVESRITEVIEQRIAGLEGITQIESVSRNGRSTITVEFTVARDIDAAANDIRDRVAAIVDNLPDEADPPDITKEDSSDDVILWMNLVSPGMSVPQLTDYADRYVVDRFSVLDGVARVRIGGAQYYAMRVWLDRDALAARRLTVNDVEQALRAENVELPAGSIESREQQFTVRIARQFHQPQDFEQLVISAGEQGALVRLQDVARVELGSVEERSLFRGNGEPMVGIGITKQSTANVLAVAELAKQRMVQVNQRLPQGMMLKLSYDSSVFVAGAIREVVTTLLIAIALVVLVILLFLRDWRATLIPALTVPISLVATFLALYAFGFTVNMFTLLALVLAIGLVVDDAIVVLENIYRRMHSGESRLVAAYRGSRQIAFAVVATTLVLIAVFVPIAFLQGDIGRLFSEFALTMAAAVAFSSVVALTLAPALASKLLPKQAATQVGASTVWLRFQQGYERLLAVLLRAKGWVLLGFLALCAGALWVYQQLPEEYAPKEDRGAFFIIINGPEGATYDYMREYMAVIEQRLSGLLESGEARRVLVRAPRGFGNIEDFNSGFAIIVLEDWAQRRSGWEIMQQVRLQLADLPGVRAFPVMRQGFGGGVKKPVQFVIGGGSYAELVQWRETLSAALAQDNPGLRGVDFDYKETKPYLQVDIDYAQAADLGVTVREIGQTLETLLGSRVVTSFQQEGREYDVIVEGLRDQQRTPQAIQGIYVRSERTGALVPLASLVSFTTYADAASLNRFNRIRAMTLQANLDPKLTLGEALAHLEQLVAEQLPAHAIVDYKGQSADFKNTSAAIYFTLLLGIAVVFLVLAAQFESYIHPLVIMLTVPLAICGGLWGLYWTGQSLNLFSQIGLIMLVGLAAKNGILIVEFANQLRDQGLAFTQALISASGARLRPILMTGITTVAGALPLIMSSGAGVETRKVVGVVIFAGVLAATLFTLLIVPVAYHWLAARTQSPGHVAAQLQREIEQHSTTE